MISRDEAGQSVERYLRSVPRASCRSPWIILYDRTVDCEQFWLFSWTSAAAHRRGAGMVGNLPIAVAKGDGGMYFWSLLYPFDEFAERFRRDRASLPRAESQRWAGASNTADLRRAGKREG